MSRKFLANILLLVLLRIFLDLGYIYFVVPKFGYEGFKLSPDPVQYILSWFLYISSFFVTPCRLRKVSDAVFIMVSVSIIAPVTSMYGLSNESVAPVVMSLVSMFVVYAIVNMSMFRTIRFPYMRDGERLAVIISVVMIVVVALHYMISGVHFSLSLAKVYDFRESNAEVASAGVFSYLNSWAYEVFNLFLIAICLMRRRYWLTVAFCGVQVFLFAASQHKSALFAPALILGVWWYLRKSESLLIIPASICGLIGISLLSYALYHNMMFPSMAIRRTFFIPAHLSFTYYNFFSVHPKVIWGDSFWMPFVHSPYSTTIPYVIGTFLGSPNMSANNGYVSSGFAQAGLVGVALYTVVLGYALKFVDNESMRFDAVWLGVGLFLLPFITIWLSSDLTTSMLTHGFLLMLVLLGLLRKPEQHSEIMEPSAMTSQSVTP